VLALGFAGILAGCSAQPDPLADKSPSPPRSVSTSAASKVHIVLPSGKIETAGQRAAGPQEIKQLTNEKLVFECPKCGSDYDRAGECVMDGATLVKTNVRYVCPADNNAVDAAGRCPRCAMNARIEKTVASNDATGKTTRN
jgi:hypothetical protein